MTDIILINLSGLNKHTIITEITSILSEFQVDILDITQAVTHDTLVLGILAGMPENTVSYKLIDTITEYAANTNLFVNIESISNEEYNKWQINEGKPRHIITLLARKISAEQLTNITAIIQRYQLTIDHINRLSGRIPLKNANINTNSKACIELTMRGEPTDISAMRTELLSAADELDIDIALQEDTIFRRNRRLIAFDMDSTLIQAEVIDELAKLAGAGAEVVNITERTMNGEIDFDTSLQQRAALLAGLEESTLEIVANQLQITDGATRLINTLKKLGYKTAIISGGFTYFGYYLQKKLNIDYVFANQLEIKNNQLTGKVIPPIVNGKKKAEILQEIAKKESISLEQTIAVGDGANDLPMLSIAGLGIAFHAKAIVKKSAEQSISTFGLDSILYLLGYQDREII